MQDEQKIPKDMLAAAVAELQTGLSLTMLSLSSILERGLQLGMLTLDDYSALKKDFKIYVTSATLIKADLNNVFVKLLERKDLDEENN